jgi:hypothetical protein
MHKDKGEDQRIVELRKILSEQENDTGVGSVKLVTDAIAFVQDRGYLTETGALTDTLAPPGATLEKRRRIQVAAAWFSQRMSSESARLSRRDVLIGAISGTIGTVGGGYLLNRAEDPETYEDAFIRQILRLHSSRPELHTWQKNCSMREGREKQILLEVYLCMEKVLEMHLRR